MAQPVQPVQLVRPMQQAPPAPPGREAFQKLHKMISAVLIETGRVFADPSKRTPQSVAHTNARLKSFVAQAQEHFHESVDELEGELLNAQAVMRRDLALCRAEKARKEQAEAAERQRIAAELEAAKKAASPKETAVIDNMSTQPNQSVEQIVTMTDGPDVTGETSGHNEEIRDGSGNEGTLPDANIPPARPQPGGNTAPNTTSAPPTESNKVAQAQQSTDRQGDLDWELFDRTPTTAGIKEIDFDSMFDTAADSAGGGKQLNASDNSGALETAAKDDFDLLDMPAAGDDTNQAGAFASDDVSSLLPGLESYANGAGAPDSSSGMDYQFLDQPGAPSTADVSKRFQDGDAHQQGQQPGQQDNQFSDNQNFSDLFGYSNFEMGQAGEGGEVEAGGTEFDDAFFGLDGA